jgi:hypothetical protein
MESGAGGTYKNYTELALVLECVQILGKLSEFNVTLVWILWHQRIPDSEEADKLAKEGAIEVPLTSLLLYPLVYIKKLIKKQLELRHHARWTACTGCRQSKVLMRYSLPSRSNGLLAMSKLRLMAINRPCKPEGSLVQTWTHRTARMPAVWVR